MSAPAVAESLRESKILAVMAVKLLNHGSLDDFAAIFAPTAVNRPGKYAPAPCRGRGPNAIHATSLWLRRAFTDLDWTIRAVSADASQVAVRAEMTGRHTGKLVLHGAPARIIAPSDLRFTVGRTYRFRIAEHRIIERSVDFGELGPT
ncbi:ester cyclase [Nocardia sp. NPDC058658]|uniref:ester cyclase n=1 Tax=Nocardia sp. NPDC058658 TaxID=3346580 RepID=UPI00364FA1DF